MSAIPLVRLEPAALPPRWEVRVPGSKSLMNRALLLAAVADDCFTMENRLVELVRLPEALGCTSSQSGTLELTGPRKVSGSTG